MTNPASWSEAFRRELQKKLAEQGFYQGKVDADIGPGTRRAIAEAVKRGT